MPTLVLDSGADCADDLFMFVRCKTRRKDGKEHRYWSVVENVRVRGGRVVQRQVLYLGEINDSQIEIEAFDDPKIEGGDLSSQPGGDRRGGQVHRDERRHLRCIDRLPADRTDQDHRAAGRRRKVFSERRSVIFKTLQVVRFCDRKRNTLVYLVYSTKVIEGSPKNSISTVPMMPWQTSGGVQVAAECGGDTEE